MLSVNENSMIELKKVSKVYELGGEKIYALDSVSLKVENGDFLAIMGPSGSGKSTLANVIGGLDTPDSGQVIVDDQDIAELNDTKLSKYRNQKIGFIFQSFNLQFTLTAIENVTIPLLFAHISPGQRKKRAMQCLKAVGLDNRMNHKPGQLSGGQRQRVCIARALVNNPSIIIADEPTGNLDSKKGGEIVALLKALNKQEQITIIVITHDKTVASEAREVLNMKDGKLL